MATSGWRWQRGNYAAAPQGDDPVETMASLEREASSSKMILHFTFLPFTLSTLLIGIVLLLAFSPCTITEPLQYISLRLGALVPSPSSSPSRRPLLNIPPDPKTVALRGGGVASGVTLTDSQAKQADDEMTADGVSGGHWEHAEDVSPPYTFSPRVCHFSFLNEVDCIKTRTACPSDLMNWIYVGGDAKPYPRFDADGFRRRMRNRRILFIGPSMVRQQVQSLVWSLGHEIIEWDVTRPPRGSKSKCDTSRRCMVDAESNITLCHQFLGSMSTSRVYREGNYTLDHSLRGHGDSSCLLRDEMLSELEDFDLAVVQSVAWWTNLVNILDSPSSPSKWLAKMVPVMYRDSMEVLLSRLSERTKTVFTLGQIGTDCKNKTEPEPFSTVSIPGKFGWNLAPQLWNTSLSLIEEGGLDVQVVDAREPLMQSVHAHPSPDCLHFCMNSAAVNIYLDMYWNEVFSQYSG